MVTLTESAVKKVFDLMEHHGCQDTALRINVIGGGCSGLQYSLSFEKDFSPADKLIESSGVKICIDSKSALYLEGVEIDYIEGLMGTGFKLHNPNAKSTCGCGESFNV